MNSDEPSPLPNHSHWRPLPDPVQEDEIMGFATPTEYLRQALAAVIAGNEEDSILAGDRRIRCRQYGYDKDGGPHDV